MRSTVETALSQLQTPTQEQQLAAHASQVLQLTHACTHNACLSIGSNIELVMVHKELEVQIIVALSDSKTMLI